MRKYKLVHIVGARPNFMKLAPVYQALSKYKSFDQFIIHTGQHYDHNMSDIFFEQLGIPQPQINLNISGTSALSQIANGILKLEDSLPELKPDLVIIYGDINATACASIVCSKSGIKIAHVEAGLRSFDKSMPEETNRMIADTLSDYFFTPSKDADFNLLHAGINKEQIFFVGNVMIDTLVNFLPLTQNVRHDFEIPAEYGLITLHRPANVDDEAQLMKILETLKEISIKCPLIFPVHPRTKIKIPDNFYSEAPQIIFTQPLSYISFLDLQQHAKFVITDSGGIQEETTYLGVKCFTFRDNTERPVTITEGTNTLTGINTKDLFKEVQSFLQNPYTNKKLPELWDGNASNRIADILYRLLSEEENR